MNALWFAGLMMAGQAIGAAPPEPASKPAVIKPPAQAASACTLEIEGEGVETLMLDGPGGVGQTVRCAGNTVTLPAGTYTLRGVMLRGGPRWLAGRGSAEQFVLAPGKPHRLQAGAPLRPQVSAARQSRAIRMGFKLVDAAGRQYSPSLRGQPPQFAVFKDQQQIGAGAFRFG